jgi:hypothetical protein
MGTQNRRYLLPIRWLRNNNTKAYLSHQYNQLHQLCWQVGGDVKVIEVLLGSQKGSAKYAVFTRLLDSRVTEKHYNMKKWTTREDFVSGIYNVTPLSWLMTKAAAAASTALHLQSKFPNLNDAKFKRNLMFGPTNGKVILDENLETKLNRTKFSAWKSLRY